MYKKGEKLYISNEAVKQMAKRMQDEYTEENILLERIEDYLNKKVPENWYTLSVWDKRDLMENYGSNVDETWVERTKVNKFELWEIALGEKGTIPSNIPCFPRWDFVRYYFYCFPIYST